VRKFKPKKYYLTTAIAYPNSSPHLGHSLEIVQADVFARFNRLLGKDVFFQTGTDEHGNKNWQTAQKEGKDILEFLDKNVRIFKDLFKKLNISYDYFIRTSDKKIHYPGSIKLWKQLVKAGDIYKKKYKGLYCTGCESFKTERELENGRCPNHPTREIEAVEEENYFFKLSKYKEEVAKKIRSDEYKIIPEVRKNEILSFLKEAKDISFSRPKTSLPWGVPVPDDDEQVMYVWCDALSNYITGVGYGRDESEFKKLWPADIHIIGKDILRFHAAFWPAMLISAKVDLPKQLFVHGFILSKGTKMSKSTGNIIEPFEQIEKYGVEPFRFYLTSAMPLEGDGEYSEDLLLDKVNSGLAANIGNFCYRVLNFLNKNFDGKVGNIDDDKIINEIEDELDNVKKNYENLNFNEVVKRILHVSSLGNKYFQENEPWKLIKEDKEKAHKVVGLCVNIVKNLSVLISPIMPEFSSRLQKQLNLKDLKWKDVNFKLKNHKIGKDEILIRKIEEKEEKPIFPLNLKVAEVIEVNEHPNADNLNIINIDLGSEKRQIVAGLKKFYSADELKNKKLIVISNLKKAKLRGVESQAMLLAGDDGKEVGVLTVDEGEPGDKVYFEGFENGTKEISFDSFLKIKMTVKDSKAYFEGKELRTDKEIVRVEKVSDGAKVR
jgi:methionyl-tRNA synthetase|tara:strand:+ start:14585 stop:16570 length:1986 start_codon:yes stop_codon:yes gene_type:complete